MKSVLLFVIGFIAVVLCADPPLPQVAPDYTVGMHNFNKMIK